MAIDIKDKMKTLVKLQEIDTKISSVFKRKEKIPEEIQDIEKLMKKMDEGVKSKEELKNKEKIKIKDLEKRAEEEKIKLDGYKKRQYQVKTNEEYRAIVKEIEFSKQKADILEMDIIMAYDTLEKKDRALKEEMENVKKRKITLTKEIEELKKEYKNIDEEIPILEDKKKGIAVHIEEGLLKRYERLRKARNGIAVSIVDKPICSGCFAHIPPQHFAEIKRGDKLYTCESCGRFLIYKENIL